MRFALIVLLAVLGHAFGFAPIGARGLSSPRSMTRVASRGPALQMGFIDDIMKMFNGGGDDSSAAPTSSVSTPPAAVAWVNPEPGRFPPMITVPPAPKRKLVLKDLKTEQLKGKR